MPSQKIKKLRSGPPRDTLPPGDTFSVKVFRGALNLILTAQQLTVYVSPMPPMQGEMSRSKKHEDRVENRDNRESERLEERSPNSLRQYLKMLEAYTKSDEVILPEYKISHFPGQNSQGFFNPEEIKTIKTKCIEEGAHRMDFALAEVKNTRETEPSWIRILYLHCSLKNENNISGSVGNFVSNDEEPYIIIKASVDENGERQIINGTEEHEIMHYLSYKNYTNAHKNKEVEFRADQIYTQGELLLFGIPENKPISFAFLTEMASQGLEIKKFSNDQANQELVNNGRRKQTVYQMAWEIGRQLGYKKGIPNQKDLIEKIRKLNLTKAQYEIIGEAMILFAQHGMQKIEDHFNTNLLGSIKKISPGWNHPPKEWSPYHTFQFSSVLLQSEQGRELLEEKMEESPYSALTCAETLVGNDFGLKLLRKASKKDLEMAFLVLNQSWENPKVQILIEILANEDPKSAALAHGAFERNDKIRSWLIDFALKNRGAFWEIALRNQEIIADSNTGFKLLASLNINPEDPCGEELAWLRENVSQPTRFYLELICSR